MFGSPPARRVSGVDYADRLWPADGASPGADPSPRARGLPRDPGWAGNHPNRASTDPNRAAVDAAAVGADLPTTGAGAAGGPWAPHCLPDPLLIRRLLVLQSALGEPVVACATTAANLHGFGVLPDPVLHATTVSGRRAASLAGVRMHRLTPHLPLVDLGLVWAVHPAETAIEVARAAAPPDVLAVLDAARRSGVPLDALVSAAEMADATIDLPEVRRLLEHTDPRAESAMESRTRFWTLEAELPPPDLQVLVALSPGVFRRLDLGWRRRRVGLEFDGPGPGAPAGALAGDRLRHRQLRSAGWTVLYATASDVVGNPRPLIRRLRPLLT